MYQIYIDRKRAEIKISNLKDTFRGTASERCAKQNPSVIVPYNFNYSFCEDRSVLVRYAKELKEEWLEDAHKLVEKIERIKI